ncbi:hypothetical protein GCM10010909_06610 [Acidocella aquatica]|uniref:Uncharacterized protein n=1 Tax=Acidocella aquatica TaxID=1922313 RepID=A0ABQ6A3Q2_9PROT|nr:hypothetical protein GCM10010909_06610 [Acidocella aquatica]
MPESPQAVKMAKKRQILEKMPVMAPAPVFAGLVWPGYENGALEGAPLGKFRLIRPREIKLF